MKARFANIPKRLRAHRRGFTFAETMAALLIFVVLSAVVTAGIPVAFRTYQQVVNGSNAELALATTTAALRDELGMAAAVASAADGAVFYQSTDGQWHQIANSSDGSHLVVKTFGAAAYFNPNDPGTSSEATLIPDSVRKTNAKGTNGEIGISMGSVTYQQLNSDAANPVFGFVVNNLKAEIGDWSQEVAAYEVRPVLGIEEK